MSQSQPASKPGGVDAVVVAASAGGVGALRILVSRLPPELPAAVLVVMHIPSSGRTALPRILERAGPLPARVPEDGEPLECGRIRVAPPDEHLIVAGRRLRLSRAPRQHGHRPAADPLLCSAAVEAGPRALGVVLSGMLDDGTAGCAAVRRCGGDVLVQDPATAAYPDMPRNALLGADGAQALSLDEIAAFIVDASRTPSGDGPETPEDLVSDVEFFIREVPPLGGEARGEPAGFSCPDCNGPLYENKQGKVRTFHCRVGHGWSPTSLLPQQDSSPEDSLWMALRSLDERASLAGRLAEVASARGHSRSVRHFTKTAEDAHHAAEDIRNVLRRQVGREVRGNRRKGNAEREA